MSGSTEYTQKIKERTLKYINNSYNEKILKGFLNWLGADKSANTKEQYVKIANRFIEHSGAIDVEDLTIDEYIDFFSTFDEKTSSYRMMVYAALINLSEYFYDTGKNKDHPMKKVKAPKQIDSQETVEKREKGVLTEDEIKVFINNIKNGVGTEKSHAKQEQWRSRDLFLLYFMLSNGPRVSAVAKMDVSDIKRDTDTTYIITTEKRGKVRKYYLSDDLRMLLEEYLIFRDEYLDGTGTDALFISNQKKRMTIASIYNLVKKYSENFKKISPHKLRATFGTQLYKQSHDIYFVQQNMGHTNPTTTGLYVRGEKEDIQKKGSNMMSDLLFG